MEGVEGSHRTGCRTVHRLEGLPAMKQAIAGVAPPELGEVTVMTVYPSIAAIDIYPGPFAHLGRCLGRAYQNKTGFLDIFNVGNLTALLSIPIALGLFAHKFLPPGLCRRYRLTNRRVVVEMGFVPHDDRSVALDQFDTIEIEVLPGQEWFPAGELIFRNGTIETFRLSGVSRPETFRRTCLEAQKAYVGVQQALAAAAG